VDHPIPGASSPYSGGFDERENPIRSMGLVAEPDQVGLRSLEVLLAAEESEPEDPGVEVQTALSIGSDSRDVIYAVQSHRQQVLEYLDQ
jgi:hypothetical protein